MFYPRLPRVRSKKLKLGRNTGKDIQEELTNKDTALGYDFFFIFYPSFLERAVRWLAALSNFAQQRVTRTKLMQIHMYFHGHNCSATSLGIVFQGEFDSPLIQPGL